MRFRNIALVYECDDATLTCAATLARHHRARLTLATFDASGKSVDVRALITRTCTVVHAWPLPGEAMRRGRR